MTKAEDSPQSPSKEKPAHAPAQAPAHGPAHAPAHADKAQPPPEKTQIQLEKEKAIELTLATVEKQFGKGAIMRLGDTLADRPPVETISTGSLGLDIALGTGGVP